MRTVETTTTVLFYAFRYALGRRTGAASTVVEFFYRNIDAFAEWELRQVVKEILEFEDFYKELGDECDKVVWYDLIDTINDKLKQNDTKQTK